MTVPERVEMRGIEKRYDAAPVLHAVDFSARAGESTRSWVRTALASPR